MNNENVVLKVEHARDFCLAHIEIWCKGESTDPRPYSDKLNPVKPYILFEKTNETVNCYMQPKGFDWINTQLKNKLKEDSNFVKKLSKKYVEIYSRVQPQCEAQKALTHKELIIFIKNYALGWPEYEALYFYTEMLPQDSEDFKLARGALDFTNTTGDLADKLIRNSLKKIFLELGELSAYLLTEEIFSKKIPPKNELEKRKKKYFYTLDKLYIDKTIEDIEKMFGIKLERASSKTINEFSGQIGYKGKVQGIARKIMSYSQSDQLIEGEILVTAMTTPEFSPALKKAIAFITDEGGIASHAAIVARELKKPCIVGTKIATSVLNTGDLIELDANTGIIRILKKA